MAKVRVVEIQPAGTYGGQITVENRGPAEDDPHGPDLWAVCSGGECLSRTGRWRYEPLPSSRTDSFKRCTRFPYEEAVIRAEKEVCRRQAEYTRLMTKCVAD